MVWDLRQHVNDSEKCLAFIEVILFKVSFVRGSRCWFYPCRSVSFGVYFFYTFCSMI